MPAPSDRLREAYEQRGELQYATPSRPLPWDRKFEVFSAAVSASLPCEAFLDAGCGDGRYIASLPALGPIPDRVVGTDIADSILRTAHEAAAAAGVDAELVRANLEALPFPDDSFDLVLCVQVIEHLLAPAIGVKELARVLRPGGRLILSTDHERNLVSRVLNLPRRALVRLLGLRGRRLPVRFPHTTFSRGDLVNCVEEAGLSVVREGTFRFHLQGAHPAVPRLLNWIERRLPPHRVGDILWLEATAA